MTTASNLTRVPVGRGFGGLVALLATAATLGAQAVPSAQGPLTLDAALREADRAAFQNRIATASTTADRARAAAPLKGILPSMRVEAGAIRTTDPIGAFGTLLRQRQVTQAAFDPARLNDPAPITNVQGGLVVEVPLLNADAWTGRRAALAAASATAATGAWTAVGVRANVVRAYYGAVLAAEQVRMLEEAQRAADANVRQVQAMVQQGMVTKADALQASVHALDVASQLLSARNDVQSAREQLALLLGRSDGSLPTLPDALPADALVRGVAARDTTATAPVNLAARADVRAARDGMAAARADRDRAASTLLPRLNSFARYDWFAPTALFGGRPNWTVGVMASWSVFGGGSELADIAGASARASAARAGHEALVAQGTAEASATMRAVALALQRLELATRAAEQTREAQRLVQKRYVGGLATIAELLGADASATGKALAQSAARFAVIEALAHHRRAIGADPSDLRVLDSER
ncbi:MAG: TolC family protein [Gemmatimonadaceae bacterium]|nr:TolC family protein [Gemmatimonadaceae bacterium]